MRHVQATFAVCVVAMLCYTYVKWITIRKLAQVTQHTGTNGNLNQKQQQLLTALLAGQPTPDAAKSANVSKRTAYRWQQDPKFVQAMKDERAKVFDRARQLLIMSTTTAIRVLVEIMLDTKQPGGVRVASARAVLDNAILMYEAKEVQEGVEEMKAFLQEMGVPYVSL